MPSHRSRTFSLALWGAGSTRALRAHWMLAELGVPYVSYRIQSRTSETMDRDYLKLDAFPPRCDHLTMRFLQRLGTRQEDHDLPATQETVLAQVTAITKWGTAPKPTSLGGIQHSVLVANGDTDVMVPSINSVELARKLPHS